MNLTIKGYVPAKYAVFTGSEFDPETECHYTIFAVKAGDPGCTLEVQIEERSGRVTRLTTTEDSKQDRQTIQDSVLAALNRMFTELGI